MLASKLDTLQAALDQPAQRAGSATVLLAALHPGVELPEAMLQQKDERGMLILRYSWRFRTHMNIDSKGIEASLSCRGTDYPTFVPWGAVVCIVEDATGAQCAWPYTGEVDEAAEDKATVPAAKDSKSVRKLPETTEIKARRLGLSVVRGGKAAANEGSVEQGGPKARVALVAAKEPPDDGPAAA